jgi:purine-binding chemotaxis protein CheW
MSNHNAQSRQYATFRVADLFFGVEVLKVQELIRQQEMSPVPLAPQSIEGLINLRGQLVVAIDTRRSLGLPPAEGEDLRVNVVIKSDDGIISLLVDEICDVLDIPLTAYAPVPDNMPAELRELIECVFHVANKDVKENLMLVLDTGRLFENACN